MNKENKKLKSVFIFVLALFLVIYIFYDQPSELTKVKEVIKQPPKKQITIPQVKIVKEKKTKALSPTQITGVDAIVDISPYLEGEFEHIVFETDGGCPEGSVFDQYWSEHNRNFDVICGFVKDLDSLLSSNQFMVDQSYVNGRLKNYRQSIDAAEPLNISFRDIGDIDSISLFIQGMLVYKIKFNNNKVISYKSRPEEIEEYFNRYDVERFNLEKQRLEILMSGKKKIEKLLETICSETKDNKTCEAHEALVDFKYVSHKIPKNEN